MSRITNKIVDYIFNCTIVIIVLPSLFSNFLLADEIGAVSLNGTYDFDEDGLSEFLCIEKPDPRTGYPLSAAYYEIDAQGIHSELWRFTYSQPMKDARIVDMNGDGVPEITVLTKNNLLQEGESWLFWFPWEEVSFSQIPIAEWSGDGKDNRIPSSITSLDMDNDRRDEIALAVGSPRREIMLLTLDSDTDTPLFEIYQTLTSPSLSSGYSPIYLSSIDQNQDGYTDLMAVSRELSILKAQMFINEGGDLVEGLSYQEDISQISCDLTGVVASGINTIDINQDGANEVLLPFRTGVAIALNVVSGELLLTPVAIEVASLFTFPETGFDYTVINEILLDRAELGITGMKARKLKLEAIDMQPPAEAEEITEVEPTTPVRKVRHLELTSVEKSPEEEAPMDTVSSLVSPEEAIEEREKLSEVPEIVTEPEIVEDETAEAEPGQPKKVRKLQLTTLEKEEETITDTATVEPPSIVEISDTLLVGEKYIHSLERDEGRSLHAFRPATLPHGAFFDPPSRSITWTPTDDQIGVHKLAYEVEYEITGERVDVQEVEGTSVQVLTTTETDTVELYILVKRSEEQ